MTIINPTSFAATRVQDVNLVVLPMISARPDTTVAMDPPRAHGELIGYYNPDIDKVEIFVASGGGTYWREIG